MAAHKIYRGETVVGNFVLRDDAGQVVTNIDGAVLLLTDLRNKDTDPIALTVGHGITFDAGAFSFTIPGGTTKNLPDNVGMEIKIEIDGVVRIAATSLFQVIGNKVKDYDV